MDEFLVFEKVTRQFGAVRAVNNVSLQIKKGEFFSLLGPSGCGKTTLLRIVAGFETPDTGKVYLNGQDITELPPNKRKVNTIFQNYALFPHLTVWDNIAFGLRVAKRPSVEIKQEVERMLDLIKMKDHAHKMPHQISGGQKQRVAIARALINKPQVLLLDEPLAALDRKLRQHMLMELDVIHDQVGITFLYVTHDQDEAMSISDRIAVMDDGVIEQVGPAAHIYESPTTEFVASFIGDTNILSGTVEHECSDQLYSIEIPDLEPVLCFSKAELRVGSFLSLSIRPEKFTITRIPPEAMSGTNIVRGKVDDVHYLGSNTRYWVQVARYRIMVIQQHSRLLQNSTAIQWNDEVWLRWHADDALVLRTSPPAAEAGAPVKVGSERVKDANGEARFS